MTLERRKVDHPLWRKKVDKSLLKSNTSIPKWVCKMWGIDDDFRGVTSQHHHDSNVIIRFNEKKFSGQITELKRGKKSTQFRLWFEPSLALELQGVFVMSYLRSLEQALSKEKPKDIEEDIPFWEFLDIEFDRSKKLFKFVSYYTQKPLFPKLFQALIDSPLIQKITHENLTED